MNTIQQFSLKTTGRLLLCGVGLAVWPAPAAPVITVTQGEEGNLAAAYDSADLIQGLIATELPGTWGGIPRMATRRTNCPRSRTAMEYARRA